MNDYSYLELSEDAGVIVMTIRRPDKLNALSRAVLEELCRAVTWVQSAGSSVRVVILTGSGDRAFVAGADIAEMSEMTTTEAKTLSELGHRVCHLIETASAPFIAAVRGYALGGGCELALACDFIYAADNARFGQPEVKVGLMPGFGGTQRLARRVGAARARELIYTGEPIDAQRAYEIGLVNAVVPAGDLTERVASLARTIAKRAPLAVATSKRVLLRGTEADLLAGTELETQAFSSLFGTSDQREGTQAFVQKRAPTFTGR